MSLPPMPALRAFEATARHLSFTNAASELGMTQAGVSYQIKVLEERLGAALFLRKPGGVELTELGRQLSRPTTEAFELLRDTYAAPSDDKGTLAISATHTFATNWLSPRLGRFQMDHPGLAVRLHTSDRVVNFTRDDIDVAIRFGEGEWPGLTSHHLIDYEVSPMLSPALIAREGPINEPKDLVPLNWIGPNDPNWRAWLAEAGVPHPPCPERLAADLETQVNESRAAMAGEGAALLTPRMFRLELAMGSLVQPFPQTSKNGKAYWLVYPTARRNRKAVRAFRQFLLAEVEADAAA